MGLNTFSAQPLARAQPHGKGSWFEHGCFGVGPGVHTLWGWLELPQDLWQNWFLVSTGCCWQVWAALSTSNNPSPVAPLPATWDNLDTTTEKQPASTEEKHTSVRAAVNVNSVNRETKWKPVYEVLSDCMAPVVLWNVHKRQNNPDSSPAVGVVWRFYPAGELNFISLHSHSSSSAGKEE